MVRLGALFALALGAFQATNVQAAPANAIGDIINLLGVGIVQHINVQITLQSLSTNLVTVDINARNPLIGELTVDRVVSSAGVNGTEYSTFDHTFDPPFTIPTLSTANSGTIDNVLLTKGVAGSLDLVSLGYLDLLSTDIYVRAATIGGKLGIPVTITGITQNHVPTSYKISLT
ncbi:hypothetical protein AX17_005187 [Amanita inopinata Kibby_2008]|nr:hypothetical protein AX17_005187 [Amanita inopinata Kibby_2008]